MDVNKELSDVAASVVERAKQRRVHEEAQEAAQQQQEGRCNLIPFPKVETDPFRSELTLERHPLFVVNAFKGNCFIHERTVEDPESGKDVTQRVMVGTLEKGSNRTYGVLKQIHQELFYKLLKLWGEQGYPLSGAHGIITGTIYDMVTYLRGSDAAPHYRRVRQLLRDLASIPIVVEKAYRFHAVRDLDEFTLVAEVKWNGRKIDEETMRPRLDGRSKLEVYLSTVITEGFTRKYIKQLLWQPYASLGRRAEVARLLYPLLDHELSSKDYFHINLTALSERLGVKPQPYKSLRRRPFDRAIKLLQGKPILGDKHQLDLKITDSVDGEDCIFNARKAALQLALKGV